MKNIKKIYDNDYSLVQYYNKSWHCGVEDNDNVPMTIVVEVINMEDACGGDEFKDYPVIFSMGILNKNIHDSIKKQVTDDGEWEYALDNMIGHYGLNCYIAEQIIDMDMINKDLMSKLTIDQACKSNYKCRFTGEEKTSLKFKTENDAFEFADKLVKQYSNTIMALIGFTLDRPVNLIGETGWKNTELFEKGE